MKIFRFSKLFFLSLLIVFIMGLIRVENARAETAPNFILNPVPSVSFYNATFNNLVFELSLSSLKPEDALNAFTIRQIESAREIYDITSIILWADAQEAGFQGFGVDKELSALVWNGGCGCYFASGLDAKVSLEGNLRLFVSVKLGNGAVDGARIQFEIPPLDDADKDGIFDFGENGIFFASHQNGPSNALTNPSLQRISFSSRDIFAPIAVITNITNGALFVPKGGADSTIMILGVAQDQGSSNVQLVQLNINGVYFPVEPTGESYKTWKYLWKEPADGAYTLTLRAEDWVYNAQELERKLYVTVDSLAGISPEYSVVELDKNTLVADSYDTLNLTVFVKNGHQKPYIGSQVTFFDPSDNLSFSFDPQQSSTNADGKSIFQVLSRKIESPITVPVSVYVFDNQDGHRVEIEAISIHLTPVPLDQTVPAQSAPKEILYPQGALLKLKDKPEIFWTKNSVRHWIPSEAIFSSWDWRWSDAQEMSEFVGDLQIGEDIKFRDGTLIKGDGADVFVMSGGKRLWIADEKIFLGLGYQWQEIQRVKGTELNQYARGMDIVDISRHPDGTLIRYPKSAQVYLLENGLKRWITTPKAFRENGFSFKKVRRIPIEETYADGEVISSDER